MTLPTLIAKLEEAKGADRALDAAIVIALDIRPEAFRKDKTPLVPGESGALVQVGKGGPTIEVQRYTESLDTALTLVPEGWSRGLLAWPGYDGGLLVGEAKAVLRHITSSGGEPSVRAFAATLPLALCIAALRARLPS